MSGSEHKWLVSSSPRLGRLNSGNAVNIGIVSELLSRALLSTSGSAWQSSTEPLPCCQGSRKHVGPAATQSSPASCPFPLCFLFHFHHLRFLLLLHWICHEPTWGWCLTSGTWSGLFPGERHLDHGRGSPTCPHLRPPGHRAAQEEANETSWNKTLTTCCVRVGKFWLVTQNPAVWTRLSSKEKHWLVWERNTADEGGMHDHYPGSVHGSLSLLAGNSLEYLV